MMVSGIVVSVIWKIMLDPTLGVVPWFLRTPHLPTSAFLGDVRWAMPLIIGIDTWWQTAFVFVVLLAGAAAGLLLGRFEQPNDIAGAALFLCSSLADQVTGSHLIVSGGLPFQRSG